MNNDLPLFDITLDDFVDGMYKISLVDKPAIEENFLYFSEQEAPVLEFANDEKKEVVGPIMIPNKPILRYSAEKGHYNVQFTQEIIEEMIYQTELYLSRLRLSLANYSRLSRMEK